MKSNISKSYCYVALPSNTDISYYDPKDILLMDKICIYTGLPPDNLDKHPEGQLLCRCYFGKKAFHLADGIAGCYICLKDGHSVYSGIVGDEDCGIKLESKQFYKDIGILEMGIAPVYLRVHLKTDTPDI